MLTYNALKILDRNSVFALSESFSKKISIFFKIGKEELFGYMQDHPSSEDVIKTILRTYGGIFEFDTRINTLLLSKKLNIEESIILKGLEKLAADEVIDYKGSHSVLELNFLVLRDDDRTINPFSKNIREQNLLKEHQVSQMLLYIENDTVCRSQQLLAYFGEKGATPCGRCDVCKKTIVTNQNIKSVKKSIVHFLALKCASSRNIQQALELENELVLIALQELLEDRKISVNTKNQYQLV